MISLTPPEMPPWARSTQIFGATQALLLFAMLAGGDFGMPGALGNAIRAVAVASTVFCAIILAAETWVVERARAEWLVFWTARLVRANREKQDLENFVGMLASQAADACVQSFMLDGQGILEAIRGHGIMSQRDIADLIEQAREDAGEADGGPAKAGQAAGSKVDDEIPF